MNEDDASWPLGPTARVPSENDQDPAANATVAIEKTNINAWMNFAILYINSGGRSICKFGDCGIHVAENRQFPLKPQL